MEKIDKPISDEKNDDRVEIPARDLSKSNKKEKNDPKKKEDQ